VPLQKRDCRSELHRLGARNAGGFRRTANPEGSEVVVEMWEVGRGRPSGCGLLEG
jgi:hypothetical protein